ncbi:MULTISPECIES: anthranilate phosphoribosyltransferase [Exiguobacterium]|uniref:Anthranilate phosphoribosyltransferase n=1 Tax=Exiguobacterium chiriqhucha RW-2 TaxID=1345023 RepID=U1LYK5_9BACL|nr:MULTISPECIES: anthranilate phosphoribosyltransferase [Exiguobacterium]ERG67437.1 anthranilate phosphoribosyltransferase [Exiguobacterium chiriqhucha RW-2]
MLTRLLTNPLTTNEMKLAAAELFQADEAQIAEVLLAMKARGETAEEMAGLADYIREAATFPETTLPVLDVCGTGGDGANTFNISSTVAFVLAGLDIPVAKHGNRSVSSRSGSADVLESLNIPIVQSHEAMLADLERTNLSFLFAQHIHPVMKHVMPVRKRLATATIFNQIGPLTNPLKPKRQLIGVYHPSLIEKMATAMRHLGVERGMVVHGAGGLDEASLAGRNDVLFFNGDKVARYTVDPRDVGLMRAPLSALQGGTPAENAATLLAVLNGEQGPARDVVLLNAALALCTYGTVQTLREGVAVATASIDEGHAIRVLKQLQRTEVGA